MEFIKRSIQFAVVFLLFCAPLTAQTQKTDGVKATNADYEVWFDHQEIRNENHDDNLKVSFHVLDKKTGKSGKIQFKTDSDNFWVERLLLNGRFLSVYNTRGFADRATGFFSRFDLEKGKYLGDLQSDEMSDEAFSPNGKYLLFINFPGVGIELSHRLSHVLELISMDDQGWKHKFLNGKDHPADMGNQVGIEKPRPRGRNPRNYFILSNIVWSEDSQKAFFIAGEDLYWKKSASTNPDDVDSSAYIPYCGLITLDLSKGVNDPVFRDAPFDEKSFKTPKDAEPCYTPHIFRAELKTEGGKILARLAGTRTVQGKDVDWQTAWQEQNESGLK